MSQSTPTLSQLRQTLKTLKDKCQLQNKKIKLYRKENEQLRYQLTKQAQEDSSLLLNSKQLSQANSILENTIHDISLKLEIQLEGPSSNPSLLNQTQIPSNLSKSSSVLHSNNRPLALITLKNLSVTNQTQEVDLPKENVTDEDLKEVVHFKNIRSMILGENMIGNEGVKDICRYMQGLTKLQLNNNKFQASALSQISRLKNLRVLDIRNNLLGDSCLPYISKVQTLRDLCISKNNITDHGIDHIKQMPALVYLDITTNQITDKGVPALLMLTKLTHLYMMANRITEEEVYRMFQQFKCLEVLDVRFNVQEQEKKEQMRAKKPQKLHFFC